MSVLTFFLTCAQNSLRPEPRQLFHPSSPHDSHSQMLFLVPADDQTCVAAIPEEGAGALWDLSVPLPTPPCTPIIRPNGPGDLAINIPQRRER